MKKEDFEIYYSSLPNIELLKIIEEKDKYQPAAIEVAQEILSARGYNAEESDIAKREVDLYLDKKKQKQEKITKQIERVNEWIDENFGIKEKPAKKILNFFCLGFFLYNLIIGFFDIGDMSYLFMSKTKGYAIGVLFYLLSLLLIYLLYIRSNWGWVLMVCLYTFLSLQKVDDLIAFSQSRQFFLFVPNPYFTSIALCFNIAVLVFLNTKKISEQFSISKESRIATLVASVIIFGFFIFPMRFV